MLGRGEVKNFNATCQGTVLSTLNPVGFTQRTTSVVISFEDANNKACDGLSLEKVPNCNKSTQILEDIPIDSKFDQTIKGGNGFVGKSNQVSNLMCFENGYSQVHIPINLSDGGFDGPKEFVYGGYENHYENHYIGPVSEKAVKGSLNLEIIPPISDCVSIDSLTTQSNILMTDFDNAVPSSFDWNDLKGKAVKVKFVMNDSDKLIKLKGIVEGVTIDPKFPKYPFAGREMLVLRSLKPSGKQYFCYVDNIVTFAIIPEFSMEPGEVNDFTGKNKNKISSDYMSAHFKTPKYFEVEGEIPSRLSYLTPGIRWNPSYVIDLNTHDKTLKLNGNATFQCDLDFLKGEIIPEVSLCVGKPAMDGLNANDKKLRNVKGMRSYAECYESSDDSDEESVVEIDNSQQSQDDGQEDLFYYRLKNVPLRYNQSNTVPFLPDTGRIEYEDVYYFDLNRANDSFSSSRMGTVNAQCSILFKHLGDVPLAKGPVTIKSGTDFIALSKIGLTVGPKATAKIDIATGQSVSGHFDIKTEGQTSVVDSREIKSLKDTKTINLLSSKKRGTFTVTNTGKEDKKCNIKYTLSGSMLAESLSHIKVTDKLNSQQVELNPRKLYEWELTVPAQGKAELSFLYDVKEWERIPYSSY